MSMIFPMNEMHQAKYEQTKKKMLKKTNEKQIRLYENVLYPTS